MQKGGSQRKATDQNAQIVLAPTKPWMGWVNDLQQILHRGELRPQEVHSWQQPIQPRSSKEVNESITRSDHGNRIPMKTARGPQMHQTATSQNSLTKLVPAKC